MKNGFTFKGIHSSKMGATVKTKSRTILPELKTYSYDIPLMDGEYDFTQTNALGRGLYRDRVFEIDLQISEGNITQLERKAARIAAWLCGAGELVFDDSNATVWQARCVSGVTFTPETKGKTAVLSVIMKTEATGSATFDVADGITLGDKAYLDSALPLELENKYKFSLIQGDNEVDIINIGDFYVKPILKFMGGCGSVAVEYNEKSILVENVLDGMYIDFTKCTVTELDGSNKLPDMRGDFFELSPGKNTLKIHTDGACEMTVNYTPKTIYDFDFTAVDWGDDNA